MSDTSPGSVASAAGYPLVPDTGSDDARVRWGAREVNRTRDFIATLKGLLPTGKAGFRTSAGITSGTASPSGGASGDIYFKHA
jgi:hypothetical protein